MLYRIRQRLQKLRSNGFTLLETLAALMIVSLAALALIRLHLISLRSFEQSQSRQAAHWAARNRLELSAWESSHRGLITTNPLPEDFRPTGIGITVHSNAISSDPVQPTLHALKVLARWNEGSLKHSVELESLEIQDRNNL